MRELDCEYDYEFSMWFMDHGLNDRRVYDREELTAKLIAMLLDHGANPLALNSSGKTALDIWLRDRVGLRNSGDTDYVEELLLNSMADARECLFLDMMDIFAQTDMGRRLDTGLIEMIKLNVICLKENKRGKMITRMREIDAMLAVEGIPPGGYYYNDCINGRVEKTDVTEFRFRHYIVTTGAREYEYIVEELRDNCGRFYPGIHAEAREVFEKRLEERGIHFQ